MMDFMDHLDNYFNENNYIYLHYEGNSIHGNSIETEVIRKLLSLEV